ncbi:MAG TPA: gamma-butyrobetaine hydroxylase-like domain-containing protein [Cellvibrio sp.]|nr:gamma-butyrobetaine hydroxylase-like domain-containing protein [Cellvibrio sp.]
MSAPKKIHNSRTQKQLIIDWPTGEQHILCHGQLRAACRCAGCRRREFNGQILLLSGDLHILQITAMPQGLQLLFSDGHNRGIFPWQYLFELGKTNDESKQIERIS